MGVEEHTSEVRCAGAIAGSEAVVTCAGRSAWIVLFAGNGYISLAEACAGVLKALSNKWGKEGRVLFDRYYRSYIRAFNDAKDAALARTGHANDDDYVTKSEFRLLVVYLDYYARWYELFMAIDGRTDGVTAEDGA